MLTYYSVVLASLTFWKKESNNSKPQTAIENLNETTRNYWQCGI